MTEPESAPISHSVDLSDVRHEVDEQSKRILAWVKANQGVMNGHETGSGPDQIQRTVTLTNGLVKVRVWPELGPFFALDNVQGSNRSNAPSAQENSPQGSEEREPTRFQLIKICATGQETFDPCECSVTTFPPLEDGSAGSVVMHGLMQDSRISVYTAVTIEPSSYFVSVEVRAYNRSLTPQRLSLDLRLIQGGEESAMVTPLLRLGGRGYSTICPSNPISVIKTILAPREVLDAKCLVFPATLPKGSTVLGEECACEVDAQYLRLFAAEDIGKVRIQVALDNNETFEADTLLGLQSPIIATLPGPIKRLDVIRAGGSPIVNWPASEGIAEPLYSETANCIFNAFEASASESDRIDSLEESAFRSIRTGARVVDVPYALRSACHVHMAHLAAQEGDVQSAQRRITDALSANSNDAMSWWFRAVLSRIHGQDDEALLHARIHSPLDPVVRAETMLASAQLISPSESELAIEFSCYQDDVLEAVKCYAESGFDADAVRLASYLLEIQEIPSLRLYLAWLLSKRQESVADAGYQVRSLQPPPLLGFRKPTSFDEAAIADLSARFPEIKALQPWKEWAASYAMA